MRKKPQQWGRKWENWDRESRMSGPRQAKKEKAHDLLPFGGGKLFMLAQLPRKWQPMTGRKRKWGVWSERPRRTQGGRLRLWAKSRRDGGRHSAGREIKTWKRGVQPKDETSLGSNHFGGNREEAILFGKTGKRVCVHWGQLLPTA